MLSPSSFESELFRLINDWKRQSESDESISLCSNVSAKHADSIFFPNVRELLKIFSVSPMGSKEAERSFSFVRRIDIYLGSQHNDY